MDTVLVIGVGALGRRVVRHCQSRGVEVIAASRTRPPDVSGNWVALDARDSTEVSRVASGANAVILCAAPPLQRWQSDFTDLLDGVLGGLRDRSTALVFASNMYPYGRFTEPFTEASAERPVSPSGTLRAALDKQVLLQHRGDGLRTSVVRSASFYGPGVDVSMVGTSQLRSAAEGTKIDALGSVDQPHSLTYIDDFARALVSVAAEPSAQGRVWHAPVQAPMTVRDFMTEVTDRLPISGEPSFRIAIPTMVTMMGLFSPTMRALKENLHQYTGPFIVDDSSYRDAFADEATPFADSLTATLADAALEPGASQQP